jgi:hypothetical protein
MKEIGGKKRASLISNCDLVFVMPPMHPMQGLGKIHARCEVSGEVSKVHNFTSYQQFQHL